MTESTKQVINDIEEVLGKLGLKEANLNATETNVIKIYKETTGESKASTKMTIPVKQCEKLGIGNIFAKDIRSIDIYLKNKEKNIDQRYELKNYDLSAIEGHHITVLELNDTPLLFINHDMQYSKIAPNKLYLDLYRSRIKSLFIRYIKLSVFMFVTVSILALLCLGIGHTTVFKALISGGNIIGMTLIGIYLIRKKAITEKNLMELNRLLNQYAECKLEQGVEQ